MAETAADSPFTLLRLAALGDACERDDYFTQWSGGFVGVVSLTYASHCAWLSVDRGRVRAVGCDAAERFDIGLAGPPETWESIWSGLPGGLHRAWRQKLLIFEGDPMVVMANYRMIWRLGEVMVVSRWRDRCRT